MSAAMSPSPERFAAIVPIRSWTTGKSRLGLDDAERTSLGRAFALDLIDVLQQSPDIDLVVVVTADDDVRAAVDGCDVVQDRGRSQDDAVSQGCAHALASGRTHAIVVPSDLPCLTVDALAEVVRMSEGHEHAFCPDAEGDGTSIIVSRDPVGLVTSYGPGSAAAHRAAGLIPLVAAPAEACRDVDTVAHLREAESLGVGRRTAAAIADLRSRLSPRP
jgi:2-phospho-L-lactate/phosphoenolpyruvate guanylyltransferase